jgi:glycosyltransferase involved in cell wall biosynthesis
VGRATLLVVAHAADRAGSVKVLLDVMQRMQPTLELPVAVQLQARGPLADDLLALGAPARPGDHPAAIWVNNAAAAGCLWQHPASTPSLVHVHEEDEALEVLSPHVLDAVRERADAVVCVSSRSAAHLQRLGVHPAVLHVVPPPVSAPVVAAGAVDRLRHDLGLADRRVVLGCGEATWRKGADLFLDIAAHLAADPDLAFVWIGRRRPAPFAIALDRDAELCGLAERVHWLGDVAEPGAHLALADVLVMPSREDPRPLAPLEAALVGTPTSAFAVGGLATMAANDAAVAAPYPDCRALAAATRALLDDPAHAAAVSQRAAQLARRDQDPDLIAAQLGSILGGLLTTTPDGA